MAKDLKLSLRNKLDQIAPEYGLVELSYPSFARCFGYRSQPLSACDAVEAISALLDIAGGVRMEVEIEGARNGGEWFGGGKVWEGGKWREEDRDGVAPEAITKIVRVSDEKEDTDGEDSQWVRNFWMAFDAVNE